jgi:dihydroorotate dehydrogenase (fumarate)
MKLATEYLELRLKNPLISGASPLADDLDRVRRLEDAGASAIVLSSLFEEQIVLENEAREHHHDGHADSFAEATTYLPPQIDDFERSCEQYLRHLSRVKQAVSIPVFGSLNGITPGGWVEYARLIEQAGADALELNYYDVPSNPDETGAEVELRALEVVRGVRDEIKIPLAVKLSPFFSSLPNFASRLVAAGANGLVLFNRFYQPDIDIESSEANPALELSTSSELRLRLRWVAILSARLHTSYAITGGVHTASDFVRSIMAGANVVQMVSALLRNGPEHAKSVLKSVIRWLEANEYESISQLRGSMNLQCCPDATAFERANYLRILQGWRV